MAIKYRLRGADKIWNSVEVESRSLQTQSRLRFVRTATLLLRLQLVVMLANKALNVTRHADELCPLFFV